MAVFLSHKDRAELVQILKLVNPLTATAYGPALDTWLGYALIAGEGKSIDALVGILRTINPMTVAAYGPALDAWAALAKILPMAGARVALTQVLRTINPMTASAYGPALDRWAELWERRRTPSRPTGPLVA
ncbi:MAG: hypothetical protein IPK81_16585 [Rhodospirillales bacterium]|nr:MAG: hypothetical protein IPK81_16585 [Rhodospirillales bacterium]